ncbi:hypothetical protein GOBAR_AA34349 [Gossypium barbadense]|uniref:Uncharacterized protein n=1 Tax=Gossypium barbadense TaxID=3634 RepID=A0A2P5W5J1_GOSBA|nr:hypothetical protein GOBAR_AA34349 [Gossypium barbadense]
MRKNHRRDEENREKIVNKRSMLMEGGVWIVRCAVVARPRLHHMAVVTYRIPCLRKFLPYFTRPYRTAVSPFVVWARPKACPCALPCGLENLCFNDSSSLSRWGMAQECEELRPNSRYFLEIILAGWDMGLD